MHNFFEIIQYYSTRTTLNQFRLGPASKQSTNLVCTHRILVYYTITAEHIAFSEVILLF